MAAIPHAHQLAGVGVGQWFEQHRVDDAEDRGVGSDAEPESDDGDRGEDRRTAEDTERVAQVGLEVVPETHAAGLESFLAVTLLGAEGEASLAARFIGRKSPIHSGIGLHLKMESHFVRNVLVDALARQEGAEAAEELGGGTMVGPSVGRSVGQLVRRTRFTAPDQVRHASVSRASCFFPAAVRW